MMLPLTRAAPDSDKSWVWKARDCCDGVPRAAKFALPIASKDFIVTFRDAFDSC